MKCKNEWEKVQSGYSMLANSRFLQRNRPMVKYDKKRENY